MRATCIRQVISSLCSRFLDNAEDIAKLRNCFAGLWSLYDADAVKSAIEKPDLFVLKPQREGGGYVLHPSLYCLLCFQFLTIWCAVIFQGITFMGMIWGKHWLNCSGKAPKNLLHTFWCRGSFQWLLLLFWLGKVFGIRKMQSQN